MLKTLFPSLSRLRFTVQLVMLFVTALGTGTAALVPVLGFSYGLSVVYLARSAALDFVTLLPKPHHAYPKYYLKIARLLSNV